MNPLKEEYMHNINACGKILYESLRVEISMAGLRNCPAI
jgi:hypothetical protein